MGDIREYLIGVIAAALLCGIITTLTDAKGPIGMAIKLVAGLLMILAVVRPWVSISFDGLFDWTDGITAEGTSHMLSGQNMAQDTYRASIKAQTEAYILDEAKNLGCILSVEVFLSDDDPPVPKQVRLSGNISPYARQTLMGMIEERLGIKREDQIWT